MKKVYFDSAATTQLRDDVITCITEVLKTEYGNPSSTHSYGRSSKSLLENARKEIAKFLNVSASEIIFTSGGTEADNLILISAVRDLGVKRIISSKIEHHAVLHTIEWLQKEYNTKVDFVKLNDCGQVDHENLESLLQATSEKTLVSLMHVNNEVGNILDLKERLYFVKNTKHFSIVIQFSPLGILILIFRKYRLILRPAAAHKFHGPKGAGFAFIQKKFWVRSLIHGGEQERGLARRY